MQLYQPHWIMYDSLHSYIYLVHVIIPTTLDHVQQFTLNTVIQYMSLYQPHWIMYNSLHSIHLSSTCNYTNHTGSCSTVYTQYMYPVHAIIPTTLDWICTTVYTQYIYPVHAIIPITLDHVQQFTLNTFIQYMSLSQPHWIICTTVYTQYSYPVHVIIPTTLDHVQQFTRNTANQYMHLYQPHWNMYNQFTLNTVI